jgi:threonine/homoserine/homoserine lactone efflux protein
MTHEFWIVYLPVLGPLVVFVFGMSITPGPNNMMLMASGAQFGVRKTLLHLLGVILGFNLMLIGFAFGLGWIFEQWPILHKAVKYFGIAYMIYLSFRIMTAQAQLENTEKSAQDQPLNLFQAMAFQVMNPKALAMTSTMVSTFTLPDYYSLTLIFLVLVSTMIGAICMALWMVLGYGIRNALKKPLFFRIFSVGMGVLTLGSLVLSL